MTEFQLPRAARSKTVVIDKVIRYLGDRIGQDVHVGDMVQDLDLRDTQIKAAIYSARERNAQLRQDIKVIVNGRIWRYVPGPHPPTPESIPTPVDVIAPSTVVEEEKEEVTTVKVTPRVTRPLAMPPPETTSPTPTPNRVLYEHVGSLGGNVIIRDENGQCYRIEAIDLNLT